ncbi:hypothetical protein [Tsukamurella sp. PLM1]|uniref:hypothetical protein n=1 Tax=Tsukamurella sp. PLM1 TaxID=2929795 RepID=UPI0020C0401A|nr:hypothetical protein [Tsukamurella sp. PLM1]
MALPAAGVSYLSASLPEQSCQGRGSFSGAFHAGPFGCGFSGVDGARRSFPKSVT